MCLMETEREREREKETVFIWGNGSGSSNGDERNSCEKEKRKKTHLFFSFLPTSTTTKPKKPKKPLLQPPPQARLAAVNQLYSMIESLMYELSIWRCNADVASLAAEIHARQAPAAAALAEDRKR